MTLASGGQRDAERGPLAGAALAGDAAAVRRHDLAHDRQPQPGTALMRLPGHPRKALEKVRQMLGRNAHAGVRHRQHHGPVRGRRRQRDSPAALGVSQSVVQQVAQGVPHPCHIDRDRRQIVCGLDRDRHFLVVGARLDRLGGGAQQRHRRLRHALQLQPPFLDAGQVEQVVDHRQQSLGVVAGVQQQLDLLGRQRADRLFQEQMHDQANAGQRRLQLVADRGHEVALDLVEQAEARHVQEQHGGAERVAVGVGDGQDARQEEVLLAAQRQDDDLAEPVGQVRLLLEQRLLQRRSQRLGRPPGQDDVALRARLDAEQALGRGVGHLDRPLRVDHQDRVGKGVDGRLAGALGAEQAVVAGPAVGA